METTEKKEFDPEQFRQDLSELAQAYIEADGKGDEMEKHLVFEAMLRLGSDAMAMEPTGGQEARDKLRAIKEIVMELKGTPNPETLYWQMLRYGYGEATMGLLATGSREKALLETLERDLLISIVRIAALVCAARTIGKEGYLKEAITTEFDALVEKIASLPPKDAAKALKIAKKHFASLEQPAEDGPKALRAPGLRSYLMLYRAVCERMCKKRANLLL